MKPHVVQIGFDPRKPISTVSHICSECGSHVNIYEHYPNGNIEELDTVMCDNCSTLLSAKYDTEWKPPKDIEEALKKQKPRKVSIKVIPSEEHCEVYSDTNIVYKCPHCHKQLACSVEIKHCYNCGQKLEW